MVFPLINILNSIDEILNIKSFLRSWDKLYSVTDHHPFYL